MTHPAPHEWLLARPSLVSVRGYAQGGGEVVATRTGFFVSANLIVLGMFLDDLSVKNRRVFDCQDQEILSLEVLARDLTADLHLAYVKIENGRPGFPPAVTSPPNVGDVLRLLGPLDDCTEFECTEFEFQGVRELPGWGSVLRIAFATDELDGDLIVNQDGELVGVHRFGVEDRKAEDRRIPFDPGPLDGSPIVNEDGQLVGVARYRLVDGQQEQFGLPASCVFSLLQQGVSSALEGQEQRGAEIAALKDELANVARRLKTKLARQKVALDESTTAAAYYQERANRWEEQYERLKRLQRKAIRRVLVLIAVILTAWSFPRAFREGSQVKVYSPAGRTYPAMYVAEGHGRGTIRFSNGNHVPLQSTECASDGGFAGSSCDGYDSRGKLWIVAYSYSDQLAHPVAFLLGCGWLGTAIWLIRKAFRARHSAKVAGQNVIAQSK